MKGEYLSTTLGQNGRFHALSSQLFNSTTIMLSPSSSSSSYPLPFEHTQFTPLLQTSACGSTRISYLGELDKLIPTSQDRTKVINFYILIYVLTIINRMFLHYQINVVYWFHWLVRLVNVFKFQWE